VTLAAAMAQEPRLLVLDEPTQGLDRAGVGRVSRVVRDLASTGVAVLAVTHDLAFVAEALDRTVILVEGVIAYDSATRKLMASETVAATLGIVPPPAVQLSMALGLPDLPVRVADVGRAIAQRTGE
jgi:ABC-type Mn2+/Zn2+ transport system ATPase subunit